MRFVGDITGLLPELLNIIDSYDGDTHIDLEMKREYQVRIIQPFRDLFLHAPKLTAQERTAIIYAIHPSRRSVVFYHASLNFQLFIQFHFRLEYTRCGQTYLNRETKVIQIVQDYPACVALFYDPTYQIFLFDPKRISPTTDFKIFVFK